MHAAAQQSSISLAKLSHEPFILYQGRVRDTALAACRSAGFEPRIACESSELETSRSLVAADLGIAILPQLATRGLGSKSIALRLRGSMVERRVAILGRYGHSSSSSATIFRELLQHQCDFLKRFQC